MDCSRECYSRLPHELWVFCGPRSEIETQEGLVELLKKSNWDNAYFLLPRSSLSREVLLHFLQERKINHRAFDLYDTVIQKLEPISNLEDVDEIIFTSPSTVRGFLHIFGTLPRDKVLTAIGPITQRVLQKSLNALRSFLSCILIS